MPLVSVVIATYNMGKYVTEAVRSVLGQTMSDLEVIVVDDGSTDATREALSEFTGDSRVQLLFQTNQGQPKAKNAGYRAARGQFIAFCDADDYWLPQKLEWQLPVFEADAGVGVVCSPILKLLPNGSLVGQERDFYRGDILDALFMENRIPFGTAVVRRECMDQAGGFDESVPMGIDWALWLKVATRWKFDYVSQPTYVYRIWDGQMSRNWRGRYECAFRIMDSFQQAHPGRVSPDVVKDAYSATYTNLARLHARHTSVMESLRCLSSALRYRPFSRSAWRLLFTLPVIRLRAAVQ